MQTAKAYRTPQIIWMRQTLQTRQNNCQNINNTHVLIAKYFIAKATTSLGTTPHVIMVSSRHWLTIFLWLLTEELGNTILLGQTVVYTVPTLTLSYVVIIINFSVWQHDHLLTWASIVLVWWSLNKGAVTKAGKDEIPLQPRLMVMAIKWPSIYSFKQVPL